MSLSQAPQSLPPHGRASHNPHLHAPLIAPLVARRDHLRPIPADIRPELAGALAKQPDDAEPEKTAEIPVAELEAFQAKAKKYMQSDPNILDIIYNMLGQNPPKEIKSERIILRGLSQEVRGNMTAVYFQKKYPQHAAELSIKTPMLENLLSMINRKEKDPARHLTLRGVFEAVIAQFETEKFPNT